ncbi:tyrosine-type recombinase/integrase [Acidobacterium sp. S8]|uniref:tyrosine-type recombinase/integrase n=1 Tax=Acidobacterium sp. S8 TaxID=1641854 RepID=UPI00131A7A89|nr:tyrosine-type recombinase/integrase [Acidobacterium sp. S8]
MKIQSICEQYAAFRKALGERFEVNGRQLKAFWRAMGPDIDIKNILPEKVNALLVGKGPLTTSWCVRHDAFLGFYRYAISRGFIATSPLPLVIPKLPPTFQPYIYSSAELRRILCSTESCCRPRSDLDAAAMRSLILLMYGAALRTSEALSLTIGNVDLSGAVLTVRDSKFFKTRLVRIGPTTLRVLSEYAGCRHASSRNPDPPFFVGRNSKRIPIHMFERAFKQIRLHAGLRREGGSRRQPRLHDLRHTSAVHRLIAWYQEGKDVQKLLPGLSVYIGHAQLAATQTYLTMTPDLLREASLRFERYAMQEDSDA